MTGGLQSDLRRRRTQAGLSQVALAAQVDLSRQALAGIETGRQVPSTAVALRLARALRCTVEDLFALPVAPALEAHLVAPTHDGRVVLGRVDGAWVAHPLTGDDQLADAVVRGAKPGSAHVSVECFDRATACEDNVLVAGCAPLLGMLTNAVRRRGIAGGSWIRADSTRALELLSSDAVHVAGLHLTDTADPEGHSRLVRERFEGRDMVIVGLSEWRQGIAVAAGNPLDIRDARDLVRADVRFVGREPGSGAHRVLQAKLGSRAQGSATEPFLTASSHREVARLVALGLADAGIAFEGAAIEAGLDFIPLAEESFDLVVPRDRAGHRSVADTLDFLASRDFLDQAAHLPAYDLSPAGRTQSVRS